MSVRTYNLRKDGETNLSKNFKVKEFRCHDGSSEIMVSPETVKILQEVRDYFGKPVIINSAYRTPSYNKRVGGVSNSQHVVGTAVDFKIPGVPSWAIAGYLEANTSKCGIGYYATFIHLDTRGYSVKWKDSGSNVKGTFGTGDNYKLYKYREEEMDINEIKSQLLKDESFCMKVVETYFDKTKKAVAGSWSAPARKWALNEGIFTQDGEWKMPITREMGAQVMYNAHMAGEDDGK